MLISAFGFDLLGHSEGRLWVGICWGVATAAVESFGYGALYYLLTQAFSGMIGIEMIVGAGIVFAATAAMLVWLRANAYDETFSVSYANVAAARIRLADHISRLPMGSFTHKRAEVVAELITGRFQLYQDVVIHIWGLAVANAALPVLLWFLLLFVDWRLALVAIALVPVAFTTIPWSHRLLARASARVSETRDLSLSSVIEQIEGARDLRQFDLLGTRFSLAEQRLAALRKEQMNLELAPAPALLAFAFIVQLALGTVAVTGIYLTTQQLVGVATLLGFLVIAQRFFRGIGDLAINLTELRFARTVLAEIRALADEPPLPEPAHGRAPGSNAIRFENVRFSYGEDEVIGGISGDVPAGSMVALVGMSGAGKSTLAGLIARLQDVSGGAIRIGGVDVREMSSETLNRQVAMVLQDVVLFEGTIADNIRLARPDADIDDVVAAARSAEVHDFVTRLPDGYDTKVAADGVGLSGGERQRIAIARALLKDAPILILDEATSSVDLTSEERLQTALSRLTRGRTVVVVAHRLWTVTEADEIWVLDRGEIVQRGRHAELLAQEGHYRAMWNAQVEARSWRIGSDLGGS